MQSYVSDCMIQVIGSVRDVRDDLLLNVYILLHPASLRKPFVCFPQFVATLQSSPDRPGSNLFLQSGTYDAY